MIHLVPDDMVVECNTLDTLFWSTILNRGKSLQKVFPRRADKTVGGDLFSSLYHWNPQVRADCEDKATAAYIERLMGTTEYQQLRVKTKGDKYRAAGGAVRLFKELMRPQDSDLKSVLENKHWQDKAELMFGSEQAKEIALNPIKEVNQELAKYIQQHPIAGVDSLERNKYGQFSRSHQLSIVADAVGKITQDMDDAEDLSAFNQQGMSLDPNSRGERFMEALLDENIVSTVSRQDKLRQIFRVAGRMKFILEGAKTKKPAKSPVHKGTKLGGDIDALLPSELVLLADEDLEDLFYYKLHEHSLRQRDKKRREKRGQGPFICCVDVSGSMSGWRVNHAMALFVSLARLAVRDRRKVMFIPFATSHAAFEIKSASDLISALQLRDRLGFSTIFQAPLKSAHNYIKEQRDWKKADIMIVSDGGSSVPNAWVETTYKEKHELDYRMFALSVNNNCWPANMESLWDAKACVGESGDVSSLEWLNKVVERIV